MASQIRKGFFFYFGLFVLLLVAIFLVCVVVMIFNPGKSVLWLQYFSANEAAHITKTTDTNEEIDFSTISEMTIDCSYAEVVVERNNNKDLAKDQICIINNAKGFTAASEATPFQFSVKCEGTALYVSVSEPSGFLFFSKNIQIVLHASSLDDNKTNFQNINLKINTSQGDVNLGGNFLTNSVTPLTKLGSLTVETESGNIFFGSNFDTTSLNSLKLSTASGEMKSAYVTNQKTAENKKLNGLELACDASFSTKKGDIHFDALNVAGKVQFSCESGTVVNELLKTSGGASFASSSHGNYVFGEIYGNLDFAPSMETLGSPNIMIQKLHGNFVLGTVENGGSKPNLEIGQVDGNFMFYSESGKVSVGNIAGAIEILSGGNLAVNLGVDKNNSNAISIRNKNGSVKLFFKGDVSGNVFVQTEKAKVTMDVTNSANFQANFWKNNNAAEKEVLTSGVVLNIAGATLSDNNPRLVIDHGASILGNIEIVTNATVELNLVAAA